ncbi:BrnT family toxin [Nitratireductor pacificus]|uniref:PANL56 n=1 Tax=Nitratireductor pacificus pht-3B TaxID=391937 RepID=K2M4S7_9HYPH|nr:BrnT family toxin [Nitratireductor pacificus]EKF17086.1 pANL56 [Nitratireductor pacificus pht-3B]
MAAVKFEWDEQKAETNRAKHGVSFDLAAHFEFATALVVEDDRRDYGETRFVALGFIGSRIHHMSFTERAGAIRVISLRKANRREQSFYEENI